MGGLRLDVDRAARGSSHPAATPGRSTATGSATRSSCALS